MAFECTLSEFTPPTFLSLAEPTSTVVIFNIGADCDAGTVYVMHVGLDTGTPLGKAELFFFVREVDGNGDSVRELWSGKDVARFVSREERFMISSALALAVRRLFDQVRPEAVFWTVHDPLPPKKALAKYTLVAYVLSDIGYDVTRADSYYGCRAWWAELRAQVSD